MCSLKEWHVECTNTNYIMVLLLYTQCRFVNITALRIQDFGRIIMCFITISNVIPRVFDLWSSTFCISLFGSLYWAMILTIAMSLICSWYRFNICYILFCISELLNDTLWLPIFFIWCIVSLFYCCIMSFCDYYHVICVYCTLVKLNKMNWNEWVMWWSDSDSEWRVFV
jgi:hypothetical protein